MKDRQQPQTLVAPDSTRPAAAWRARGRDAGTAPPAAWRARRWRVDRSGRRGPRPAETGGGGDAAGGPRRWSGTDAAAGSLPTAPAARCQQSPVGWQRRAGVVERLTVRPGAMRWAAPPLHTAWTNGVCGDGGGGVETLGSGENRMLESGGQRRASRPIQHTNGQRAPLGGQVTIRRTGTRRCVAGQWLRTAACRRGGAQLQRARRGSGPLDEKSQTHGWDTRRWRPAGSILCRRAVRTRERTGDWGAACLEHSRCTTARRGHAGDANAAVRFTPAPLRRRALRVGRRGGGEARVPSAPLRSAPRLGEVDPSPQAGSTCNL